MTTTPEETSDAFPEDASPPRPWQFSINMLLLVMFLCSMVFASAGGVLRGLRGELGSVTYYYFVLVTLLAPPATLILVSLYYELFLLPPKDDADMD